MRICSGKKVGLYLSDISGAFDRVNRCLLLGKLAQIGLPDIFLDFLNSFLLPREGKVRVESALSDAFELANQVFQGTVLGPPLWNVFFGDAASDIPEGHQTANMFADDLTVHTYVERVTTNVILMAN